MKFFRLCTGLVLLLAILVLGGVGGTQRAVAQTASTTADSVPVITNNTAGPGIIVTKIGDTPTPVGDYVVGPGRAEVTVKPGQSVTQLIMITNRMSDARVFRLSVEDMSGSADGSKNVVLLGDQKGPYSLKDYITFPVDTVTLNLNERAQIPVTITMPLNAEPGGYYGAVLVSTVQSDAVVSDPTAPRSPIVARIGTLFFITVPGDINVSGSVTDFSTLNHQSWFQSGPINLTITFQNTGSMHLNPYGEVDVTNMFGEPVGFVTLDPWFVLPQSLRLREVTWNRELLLGRYTFTTKINRGYGDIVDEKVIHIWVLPWKFLAGTFVAVLVLFLLIRFFLRTFELKRRR